MSYTTTDKDITWDATLRVYVPNISLFENRLNLSEQSFGGKEEFDIFAKDCAEFIKDFCIYYAGEFDKFEVKKKLEYEIYTNTRDEVADLKRAYVEYARYSQNDEGDLVGTQSGINFKTLTVLSLSETRGGRELSSRLERILSNCGLLYKGKRNWNVNDLTRGTDY